MTEADRTITSDDVASMNRVSIERSAYLARLSGTALVVVGLIATLAWAWTAVRNQQELSNMTDDPSFVRRVDFATTSILILVWAALAIVAGLAARLTADFAQARVGGSITGYVAGDVLDEGLLPDGEDPTLEVDLLSNDE